jgi:multisubunit Na+/H+ antiporter MnhB subunit
MNDRHLQVRATARIVLPLAALVALSILAGSQGPADALAAGALLAGVTILHGLVFGLAANVRVLPPWLLSVALAAGMAMGFLGPMVGPPDTGPGIAGFGLALTAWSACTLVFRTVAGRIGDAAPGAD